MTAISNQPPAAASPVLRQILKEAQACQQAGRKFLAAFDLDSTLFDLTLRLSKIIEAFAKNEHNKIKFPIECKALGRIAVHSTDWGLNDSLTRGGMSEAAYPEFYKEIHRYWHESFFSNHFLCHDQPLPGAVDYVNTLHKLGADVMYLTGRDAGRMRQGTEESLVDCGFPTGTRSARLVLKPSANLHDGPFKVAILKECEKTHARIWLFENEPVNLNLVAKHCPSIGLVFIDSTHSGREPLKVTLESITHFATPLEEFRKV